jgi:hypothetical protein
MLGVTRTQTRLRDTQTCTDQHEEQHRELRVMIKSLHTHRLCSDWIPGFAL